MNQKARLTRPGCLRWLLATALILLLLGGSGLALYSQPSLQAHAADVLRAILGDEFVATLEMRLFQAQDSVQKIKYSLGLAAPSAPWQVPAVTPAITLTQVVIPMTGMSQPPSAIPLPSSTPAQAPDIPVKASGKQPSSSPTNLPTAAPETTQPAPSPTAEPEVWPPDPLTPMGTLHGEGEWSPYLTDSSGRVVAYRTFYQPDATRPFVVVAVIAFDLEHTRLHFVLGFQEPAAPNGPKRSGIMPQADKVSGHLLAMFNGGFKATHGHFGAMADGITALPARDDLGTLVIYQDGRVNMGVWGSEIQSTTDMECWRQNGPLVVADGKINPRIYNNSPKDWGYTVNDVSPTWRSGAGVSADDQTLYYFAGPSLTMEALAKSMTAARVEHGMQLDINNFWVHFVAVRDSGSQRTLEPLFPEMMKDKINRYLYAYSRDYFYVTTNP